MINVCQNDYRRTEYQYRENKLIFDGKFVNERNLCVGGAQEPH
jgi:hypothetical protein